jgi:hypothetical protein
LLKREVIILLFHKIEREETMLQGEAETQLKLRIATVAMWLVAVVVLVLLAIYANSTGWSEGGKSILTVVATLAGGGGIGIILGERSGAKDAGAKTT